MMTIYRFDTFVPLRDAGVEYEAANLSRLQAKLICNAPGHQQWYTMVPYNGKEVACIGIYRDVNGTSEVIYYYHTDVRRDPINGAVTGWYFKMAPQQTAHWLADDMLVYNL